MFADTELVDKFAALFADAEWTEVHGTKYLQDLFWKHGTDIHGRCAHGCVTEGTERGRRRAGCVEDLKNRGMFADTERVDKFATLFGTNSQFFTTATRSFTFSKSSKLI